MVPLNVMSVSEMLSFDGTARKRAQPVNVKVGVRPV